MHLTASFLLLLASFASAASYDYVIIGAGAGGLTVANRLSASGKKSVLVLEAGLPHFNDPKIDIPGLFGATQGNSTYDWNFSTVPQPLANNRAVPWARGKVVGGSTAINYMALGRPASGEIDALEGLGNPGWSWDNLFKYIKKAETFTTPYPPFAREHNLTYTLDNHGLTGPVHNSFPAFITDAQRPWTDVLSQFGFPILQDPDGGNDVGAWYALATIDNTTKTRSYAATAYYQPAASRKNLKLITNAWVSRILTTSGPTVEATGVEYYINGIRYIAAVAKGGEVIVSAGTINGPKILELSGIGSPDVLKPLGIPVKVNLPSVGEGIVDQFYSGVSYELKNQSTVTLDSRGDPEFLAAALAEYEAKKTGFLTIGVSAFALAPLQFLTSDADNLIAAQAEHVKNSNVSDNLKALWNIQVNQLQNPHKYGLIELVAFPGFLTWKSTPAEGKKHITFVVGLQLPFSRGSIHISSTNYTIQPAINPNYLTEDFDLEAAVAALKFSRKIAQTGAFADIVAAEVDPGADVQTDDQLKDYIKGFAQTFLHTTGSCSMLPRNKGGVVSPELKVYGTSNIRVVDLSILPIQISAHPQLTVYGIAEKASDIILGTTTV